MKSPAAPSPRVRRLHEENVARKAKKAEEQRRAEQTRRQAETAKTVLMLIVARRGNPVELARETLDKWDDL